MSSKAALHVDDYWKAFWGQLLQPKTSGKTNFKKIQKNRKKKKKMSTNKRTGWE